MNINTESLNVRKVVGIVAVLGVGMAGYVAAESGVCIFSDDFESPAARQQWLPSGGAVREENALWSTNGSHSSRTSLHVNSAQYHRSGGWESPPFPIQLNQYYRLSFSSRSQDPYFGAVLFSDDHGAQIEGDCNWETEPSAEWVERAFCFKAKSTARTGSLLFYPSCSTPFWVDDVRVEPVSRADVLAWADAIYGSMPPLTNTVPAATSGALKRTLDRLRGGQPLRVALFGDSIANDLDNAALDVLIERAFPGSKVETIFTGRGGTGWVKTRHQLQERLLVHQPNLVILLAISNDPNYLTTDLTEILNRLRRESPDTEVLLVAPHLASWLGGASYGVRQRDVVRQVAHDQKTGYLDLLQVWQNYLEANHQPVKWLLRDYLHMNERGRQLTARAIVSYLKSL